jgi:opine dehydrogenase
MNKPRFAVLGAGNGGFAMTADLTLQGYEVNFYELPSFEANIKPVEESGGLSMTAFGPGVQSNYPEGWTRIGFARPKKITTNAREAVEDSDVIMIVTPAFGHESMIDACAPYLRPGQTVMFNNANWACVKFVNKLRKMGKKDVILAETMSLLYSCRRSGPTSVHLDGIKERLAVAALPASKTAHLVEKLKSAFPQFYPAKNVLQTSLENLNMVFHPALTICQAAHIERTKGDFIFYEYGTTESVARVMQAVDNERMAVAKALNVEVKPSTEWLDIFYGAKGKDLHEAIQNTGPYKDPLGGKAPSNLKFRYLSEDVPYALVPLASIGDLLHVPTPTAKGIIAIASALNDVDYWSTGVTAEKMGIGRSTAKQIIELAS